MPRFRDSGGRKTFRSVSTKVVSPTETLPAVGCSSPAMQFSVVDFPHPEGPSSVKNSPSLMVTETSLRTATSPNCLDRCDTWTSGILAALLEEESGDASEGRREEDLDGGQGRDGTGVPLHPELEHRRADDVGVGRR